ncbi:hypothetical protein PLAN_100179 [Planktothrix rubescens CCAP 1459/22]|uniref:Uncharacterized protein n=1 Tax=Planktothrix rubescens CCAP 1459/22 TaxID=329571 RepID=A0A6J7ZGI7_PLARU|nr:hypothetical protein PLAN_100179 [Planktothrix rubescens NIVA-CYA 18]CAD0225926.1 hypothetical protein PL10110_250009 [Planktothrix agardhii]
MFKSPGQKGTPEHRNTGTPEQPPQTPRARGARGGGNAGSGVILLAVSCQY